jgi:hypothetical protein
MLVRSVINVGIIPGGRTNDENLVSSITLPLQSTNSQANSMILCLSVDLPVVSKSKTMYIHSLISKFVDCGQIGGVTKESPGGT